MTDHLVKSKNVFIFDMDGTLVETKGAFESCLTEFFTICKKEMPEYSTIASKCAITGKDWFELYFTEEDFRTYFSSSSLISELDLGKKTYIQCFREEFARLYIENGHYKKATLINEDATISLLSSMQQQGCKLILATNSRGDLARQEMTRLGLLKFFDLVVGEGDVVSEIKVKGKPDISMFNAISTSMKVHPLSHDIVMIGDTLKDMQFAENAKINFILLSSNERLVQDSSVSTFKSRTGKSIQVFSSVSGLSESYTSSKSLFL